MMTPVLKNLAIVRLVLYRLIRTQQFSDAISLFDSEEGLTLRQWEDIGDTNKNYFLQKNFSTSL